MTVPELVERFVLDSPLMEVALEEGILNLSAVARQFKPRLEAELAKNVSEAAIVMALKRFSERIRARHGRRPPRSGHTGDLIVRSNLIEFTFEVSDLIWEKQERLLQQMERSRDTFLTCTRGVFEVMLITSSSLEKAVLQAFRGEKIISRLRDLSAVVIRLSPSTVRTPGVYYSMLKRLAWGNLNVVDVVSTYTEFTIILEKGQVDRAFSILKLFLWP